MAQATQGDRITLQLQQVPSARASLNGGPASSISDWETLLIRSALQHRLRTPFFPKDTQCSLCSQVFDCSCDAQETATAGTTRWPMSSTKQSMERASTHREKKQASSNTAETPTDSRTQPRPPRRRVDHPRKTRP